MAAMLLSTPAFTTRSKSQCRDDAQRLQQQLCGRVGAHFSKPVGATSARVKTSPNHSKRTINASSLLTLRAPLRSRRYLEMYEPRLRLVENETAYKLIAAVPGVAADGINLSVTDDGLLKVDAKSKTGGRETMLQRTVRLAEDADLDSVNAVCADGILEVTVGKLQPPAPISVPVEASEPPAADELYHIVKKLPGLSADDVKITLEPLRIGRSTQSYQLAINAASAKGYGEYQLNQALPEDIIPEGATAFCCHGLLHVIVPRREPIRVTVPVASVDETSAEEGEQLQLAHFRAPGYSAEQVFLWAMPGCLRVKFQRNAKEVVERLVVLPDEVDLSSIRAACVDGVLTVSAPKSALRQTETRQVVVSAEQS